MNRRSFLAAIAALPLAALGLSRKPPIIRMNVWEGSPVIWPTNPKVFMSSNNLQWLERRTFVSGEIESLYHVLPEMFGADE